MWRTALLIFVWFGFSNATVSIDGNDVINAYVLEHSSIGTVLVDLHATDSNGGTISWSVNDTAQFSISSAGVLTVATTDIDREDLPSPHVIPVTATAISGSDSASVLVSVTVQDINDNAPVFENTDTNSDSVDVDEDETVQTTIYTILASDPDLGAGANYHFVLTNPDGYFSVGYFTGDIHITKSLDHESNTQHSLSINIADEGTPSLTTTVTITVNVVDTQDPGPVPDQKFYHASLLEGTYTSNTSPTLATVTADPGSSDGVLKYTIIDGGQDWIDQFNVGLTTGTVTVDGTFDRETISRHIVGIRITEYLSDGTTLADAPTASTTLILTINDANDNAPQFYSGAYTGFVNENVDEGHIVISSINAFDADAGSNSEFTYKILARASDFEFQINPLTGVINVTGDLDYESEDKEYDFTIVAVESEVSNPLQGSATVKIYVQDVNDHTPSIAEETYEYVVAENAFHTFTPTISASDGDASAKFNTLSFEINGIGTQSPYDHFDLSSVSTNVVQLVNSVKLDKESIDYYHMILTVKDNGPTPLSSTADIYVNVTDVNDHAPKFTMETYTATIEEEQTYTTCLTVSAMDTGDVDSINTAITYSLQVTSASSNTTLTHLLDKFTINSVTGVITCEPIKQGYNYETIILTVTATDSGTNPGPLKDTATVTIKVIDIVDAPVFTLGSYSSTIYENLAVGNNIGVTVAATPGSNDGNTHVITYSIVSGNTNGAFSIDESTGVMKVASQVGINYEQLTPNPIVVTVQALDTDETLDVESSATTTVTVSVTDVNEFAPVFTSPLGSPTYTVSEGNVTLPMTILTATATDADGTNNIPTYSLVAPAYGTFEIGKTTGILTMTKTPDREAIPASEDSRFTITLVATDTDPTPKSSTVTVTIEVSDVNDNAPVFSVKTFSISIPEDTGGAVSLLTLDAEDTKDIDENAEITYKIESISPMKAAVVKFQLDSSTGELQTGSAGFDYEDKTDRMYTVVMVAEDGGTPSKKDTATATITITDVNDNPPVLCEQHIDHSIDEFSGSTLSSSDITIISNLSCITDADSNSFQYRIVDTSKTNGWFTVDTDDGSVYIPSGTNIDREHTDTIVDKFGRAVFVFEVEVTDSSFTDANYLSDEAEITVYVKDINDNSPVFSESSVDRTLPEGVPIGTIVDIVSATDADFKTNAAITYSKSSGDTDELFTISSDGKITTAKEIDKEMIDSAVTFVIKATDTGGLSDTINVKVTITDTNDNSPVFDPSFYQTNVLENVDLDTSAAIVYATDDDSGINGEVTYEIIGGNTDNAFVIKDSTKGIIQVAGSIDRETTSFYRLVVVAKDGATGSFQRTAVAEVVITVLDVNDNTPEFLHQVHKASTPEDIANNTFVSVSPSVYATDADSGTVVYDIESGFPFTINKDNGFVYTSYTSVLDRETTDFYNITVYARDSGGMESSAILLITVTDVNDHTPEIDQSPADLDTTVTEYFSVGGLIAEVTATDEDSGVNSILRYTLTGGNGFFQVDPNYGNVTLSQSLKPFEHRDPFTLTITVTDGGLPAKKDKVIFDVQVSDENDNAPVIMHDPLEYSYPEDTDVSSPVLLAIDPALTANGVVTDADDGVNQEHSFLLDSSSSSVFDLNSDSGSLYLISPMDYENQTVYTGSIYVVDKGSPALSSATKISITLLVTDVNDLPPVLDEDVFAVNASEKTEANIPLLLVTATDGDGLEENRDISYSFTGSTPAGGLDLFKIDSKTGLVLTKVSLDDTTEGSCYLLDLEARNPGTELKDTADVKICISDQNESPFFDQSFYNFSIYENQPANYEIGYILASDPDLDPNFGSLTYSLDEASEDFELFTINATNGLLSTQMSLDREKSDYHVFSVIVKDKGSDNNFHHTSLATVFVRVLDVNDNNPQLVHSTFNTEYVISENISRNSTIANIRATDADLDTINNFRITDDPRTLFKIDHLSGVLQTEGGPNDFDRETFATYNITVEVYNADDPSKQDEAIITFSLSDVNDNKPYFTSVPEDTCLPENSPNGFELGTFVAGDKDLGINARVFYQIVDGNTAQAFTIEALTGKLKTQNPLDYEEDPLQYTLTIEVQDLGIPPLSASTDILICVTDVNDNPPVFIDPPSQPILIEEHSTKGTVVATFSVKDIDSHPFNISELSLAALGNEKGAFRFDGAENSLYVYDPEVLDYEEGTLTYTLIMEAVDTQDSTQSSSTTVTVHIIDINDHPPIFDKTDFNRSISENEAINTILEQVVASDVDTEVLTYLIVSGNEDGKFSLDESSGIMRLVESLDYETLPNYYYIIVNVTDGDFYDQAFFHFYVTNVNDVPPAINEPSDPLDIHALESTLVGGYLHTIDASDEEGDTVTFSFSNGQQVSPDGNFRIDNATGVLTLERKLDYETTEEHNFVVNVEDNGTPNLGDSIHVKVFVEDVNDNFPSFLTPPDRVVEVYENHSIGIQSPFFTVQATDKDKIDLNAGNLFYYIVSSETKYVADNNCLQPFCINQVTGNLYLNRYLDYETYSSYTVTLAISNNKNLPSNISIEDIGLSTIELDLRVLDNNDNKPQFTTYSKSFGIPDDIKVPSVVYTCKTEDQDSYGNYDKVWYRFLTYNIPFDLDKEACFIQAVEEFEQHKGKTFEIQIQAYDNEGKNPSLSTDDTLKAYVYSKLDNELLISLTDISITNVNNQLSTITNQVSNVTGGQVIITDVRYGVEDEVDVTFVVVDNGDNVEDAQDVIDRLDNVRISVANRNTSIVLSSFQSDQLPLWAMIIIIVILASIICILCCIVCAIVIADKRRKQKLKEEKYSDEFSAMTSKEYTATKNPLWVSPVLMPPKVDVDSISMVSSVARPNPVYEEQEVNIEMFDGMSSDDALSVTSREELLPPPLSTTSLTGGKNKPPTIELKPPPKAAVFIPPPPVKKDPPIIVPPAPVAIKPPVENEYRPAPAKLKPLSDSLSFSSDDDDDDDDEDISPIPAVPASQPKLQPNKKDAADGGEVVLDFMDEFDDEDPPSSDGSTEDLLEKAMRQ